MENNGIQRVLIPTDLSELSGYALHLADLLGQATGAELHALKIIEPPGETLFDPEGELLECDEYDLTQLETERSNDEKGMEQWAKDAISPIKKTVMIGRLVEDSLKYMRENNIDLVVMGTHGAKGLREWLGGSVAEKFVRFSDAPVLSLKCERKDMDWNRILLASDLSEPDGQHLEVVKDIQRTFNSEIHLLRIKRPEENDEEIRTSMDRFIERNQLKSVELDIHEAGDVEKGVLEFADSSNIDLIVIGNHGRTGLSHLFQKSISEDVVNHIQHPILTYRIDK